MTVLELLGLAVFGGLGAGARYLLDGAVMKGRQEAFPLGILIVNTLGSFLLGVVVALGGVIGATWVMILGAGMLGGFTTFSTVSVDSVVLARLDRRDWAWVNLLGTLVCGVAGAALGLVVGGLFVR